MSLQRPVLDRRPGLALYAAAEEAIEALIKERRLAPGDALPAEQELQTLFGVSRATVRQALGQLERRRIVERHQGRGTFLAIQTMELSLPQLTGFSEQVRARGMRPTSRLAEYRAVNRSRDRDAHFFPTNTPLVRITRVRCANDIPIGIHIAYLPQEIVERAGFTEASLRADPSLSLYRQLEAAGVRIQPDDDASPSTSVVGDPTGGGLDPCELRWFIDREHRIVRQREHVRECGSQLQAPLHTPGREEL